MSIQWRIQRFFGNTVFSRGIQGRSQKGHNCELWRIIFSYKPVWMAWVAVTYYRKSNYYALIYCIRHCVKGECIQIKIKFIKVSSFLIIWDKNLGFHNGLQVAKPLWIRPWHLLNMKMKFTTWTKWWKMVMSSIWHRDQWLYY